MNEQGSSEICFEETCTVDPDQTARRLFKRLEHGREFAEHLLEGLATAYLVAHVESVCIREMLAHLDHATEVIVGRAVNIQHCAPVPPGKQVRLRGWTSQIGERRTTFEFQVVDDHDIICEGSLTLVVASREVIEGQLARKL